MLRKYFKFTKSRIIFFAVVLIAIFTTQYFMTGSLLALQKVTTEAGNSNSSVIGILDETEVIRQKFCFDRNVLLNSFSISFGSYQKKDVGDTLHIQILDGNNEVVFSTDIPVTQISANAVHTIAMEHPVSIPKGVSCCIRMTCSSPTQNYALIPTVNTTNRTNPNTYMATLKMQTHAKSLNISYSYSYRQFMPMILLVLEILVLFLLVFERLGEYTVVYQKKRLRELKRAEKAQEYEKEKMAERRAQGKKNATEELKKKKKKKDVYTKKDKTYHTTTRHSVRNFIKWCISDQRVHFILRNVAIVLNPLLLMFMVECMNGTLLTVYPTVWFFGWLLLEALQLLLTAATGNLCLSCFVLDLILYPAGVANLLLMNVRGTPLLPVDFMSLVTATEVASTYSFSFTPVQFVVIPAFIIWMLILFKLRSKTVRSVKKEKKLLWKRLAFRAGAIVPAFLMISVLYQSNVLESCGIKDNVWNKVSSCKSNGFYMNFFINLHYLRVSAPSDYSEERVDEIVQYTEKEPLAQVTEDSISESTKSSTFKSNCDFATNQTLNGKKPNIILIMNESLADFDLIGDTNFNKDALPFIHSLTENTIKGKNYVSVFGAGTSNSEFEAMTGNTMAFFPSGCNVYQQFMHNSTFSLPSYLKELGYSCKAVHPSSGANWNRIATYKSMKFDDFITIDDFKKPEYVRYISDKESYKKLIELYENKGDKPIYLFDMTIQNHGGYLTNTHWKDPIEVKNSYYEEADEYLSSIHVSDQAFEYLIDYFKKQSEPTIICMFGDHFPSIETKFYEDLLGKSQSEWNLQDLQKRYAVPFILWANYQIPESSQVEISNNYLENMILKQAGIDLPVYNQFIEKVSRSIPAMNVNGYMDFDGKWYNYGKGETDTIKELLNQYEILQYGYYSDSDKEKMGEYFKQKP